MAVIAAQRIIHHLNRADARFHLMMVFQPRPQSEIGLVMTGDGFLVHRFGRLIEGSEIIILGGNEIAHLIKRQRIAGTVHRIASGQLFGQERIGSAALQQGLIKPRHRIGGGRTGSGQIFQFGARERRVAKHRVGKYFVQLGLRARFFITGQAARINIEHFDQLQQYLRRNRALVALNQIEIAGRNAQRLSHHSLRHALFAAQTAYPRTGK